MDYTISEKAPFMTIVPKEKTYLDYNIEAIPLKVLRGDGVDYTPDVNITVTDLNAGNKMFTNNNGKGDKFKVTVIIDETNTVPAHIKFEDVIAQLKQGTFSFNFSKNVRVLDALDYWIRNMTILMITTRSIDVPNGEYIITGNGNRKQTLDGYTYWELEFTRYTGKVTSKMAVNNTNTNAAIRKYNQSKKKKAAKAKSNTTDTSKLKNCKVGTNSQIKYSKTKKVTECVKLMQTVLKKKKFYSGSIDGWFGDQTLAAVKAFQKKYKTTYNLTENGKVDKKTLNALCKV